MRVPLVDLARGLHRVAQRLLHPYRRRRAARRVGCAEVPDLVLVVCQGNICRSPYAAARLAQLLPAPLRRQIQVTSAGFIGPDRRAPTDAVEVAQERGVDLRGHRSVVLTADVVRHARLILVMDPQQRRALCRRYRRSRRDVLVLGDFDPAPGECRAIADPVGGPRPAFERTYSRIDRCLAALVHALGSRASPDDPT